MYDQPAPSEEEQDQAPEEQSEGESMAAPGYEDPDGAREKTIEAE